MKKISTLSASSVIAVEFLKPRGDYDNKSRFYFGSLAAIYEMFTANDIGCNLNTLWAANITEGSPKITRNCIVSKHTVYRKKTRKVTEKVGVSERNAYLCNKTTLK